MSGTFSTLKEKTPDVSMSGVEPFSTQGTSNNVEPPVNVSMPTTVRPRKRRLYGGIPGRINPERLMGGLLKRKKALHNELGVVGLRRAVRGYARGMEISIKDPHDPGSEIDQTRDTVRRVLEMELKEMGGIKFTEVLKISLSKNVGGDRHLFKDVYFRSKAAVAIEISSLRSLTEVGGSGMLNLYESWTSEGSGWVHRQNP